MCAQGWPEVAQQRWYTTVANADMLTSCSRVRPCPALPTPARPIASACVLCLLTVWRTPQALAKKISAAPERRAVRWLQLLAGALRQRGG